MILILLAQLVFAGYLPAEQDKQPESCVLSLAVIKLRLQAESYISINKNYSGCEIDESSLSEQILNSNIVHTHVFEQPNGFKSYFYNARIKLVNCKNSDFSEINKTVQYVEQTQQCK
jgi:hypothetical protein